MQSIKFGPLYPIQSSWNYSLFVVPPLFSDKTYQWPQFRKDSLNLASTVVSQHAPHVKLINTRLLDQCSSVAC